LTSAPRPTYRADIDGRRFLVTTLAGALAAPLAVAQQAVKVHRIGMLDALRDGLRAFGYSEGRNLAIEYRCAEGRLERRASLTSSLL